MNDRDILREQRLERVKTFGAENQADWPSDSAVNQHFARLGVILDELAAKKVGQQREPVSKETLLDALWLDFKNIARTARAIQLSDPGFAGAYRVPDDFTEHAIKTHADSLLTRLEDAQGDTPDQAKAKAALRKRFTDYLLPTDFVQDLRADRDALDGKNDAKTADNLEGVESTREIGVLLDQGTKEVIRLDAMMQNLYTRNPAKLRAWHSASRVERAPRKKKPEPETPTGTANS